MRISDWSSDVCSSDLRGVGRRQLARKRRRGEVERADRGDLHGAALAEPVAGGEGQGDQGGTADIAAALSCFSVRPVLGLMLRPGRYLKDKRSNRTGRSGQPAGEEQATRRTSQQTCQPPYAAVSFLT